MPTATIPKTISRFDIQRKLGAGAQGTVYLAQDPRLKRAVAIKTLSLDEKKAGHRQRLDTLLSEARTVGQLSHPNVVPLFDAGEENELPFLVFEYVEGTVLSELIRREPRLSSRRAVAIAVELLAALGYAHRKGILHRDIKPANIILTADGVARVMDFGIAQQASAAGADAPEGLRGTPGYLAPEYINTGVYTPQCDVFAAGMTLYEMLTGAPAVTGRNVFEILHRTANEKIPPPSTRNKEVDERLDDLVMKALAADPVRRFAGADEMAGALENWLHPTPQQESGKAESDGGTLEFLLRRMRHKSDFPALSNTIGTINRVTGSDDQGANSLSNTILKDFALTNKLLRLVNTAYYGQYGGTISTVTRAVVILGFDRVRSAAMTLMLMENMQNKAQAAQLKDDVVAGYFAGLLARELVAKAGIRDAEEAFICTIFHDLGRLLTRFYLADEAEQIDRLIEQPKFDENQASIRILGLSFEELGIGVARFWNFPERMVQSMRRPPADQVQRSGTAEERLCAVAELSTGLANAIRELDAETRASQLKSLVDRFGKGLGITVEILDKAVQHSVVELKRDAGALDLRSVDGFLARARTALSPQAPAPGGDVLDTLVENASQSGMVAVPTQRQAQQEPEARKAMLNAGIQDITNTLVNQFQLNDVLRIILETMYRAMGFSRVLLCVRDPATQSLKARFGFGLQVDDIIRRGFSVPINGSRDVFQAAIANNADIMIEDINAANICSHIPDWYRKLIPSRSFALFPILVNKRPIGMFYGDADVAGALNFAADELALLKTLRNQAVLAIRSHSG